MKRRSFARTTIPLSLGLAGCSRMFSDSPMLSVAVFNQTESPFTIEMAFSRTDADLSRNEARVFSGRIDVEQDEPTVREDVVERQQYRIEYSLYEDNTSLKEQADFHYYPGDEDESGTLAFDIRPDGTLTRRWGP